MIESSAAIDESARRTSGRRVVKRYSNRKLYDTKDSRYVTLLQIAEMVRSGEDVQIIDNATKEDKTDVTLALIISEELKVKPRGIPLVTLRALIRHRGEDDLLENVRPTQDGVFVGGDSDMSETDDTESTERAEIEELKAKLAELQARVERLEEAAEQKD